MTFTELVRLIFMFLTAGCFSEKDTNMLIRLITDGDETICEKMIKAFIEADSALNRKKITIRKKIVNGR